MKKASKYLKVNFRSATLTNANVFHTKEYFVKAALKDLRYICMLDFHFGSAKRLKSDDQNGYKDQLRMRPTQSANRTPYYYSILIYLSGKLNFR